MHIVFVGLPGVPYRRRACDIRLAYFANLLSSVNEVTIVNWYSPITLNIDGRGELNETIRIVDLVKSRESKAWMSKILYIWSIIKEPFSLLKINKRKHIDVIHVYTEHVVVYITYYFIAKVIGAKLVYSYVEDRSTFEYSSKVKRKLQQISDRIAAKFSDGVIPISSYLENKALDLNPQLKSIKIPPICDFQQFEKMPIKKIIEGEYLLYCASTTYIDVAEFIAESFYNSIIHQSRKLVLILSGDEKKRNAIRKKYPEIIVLCNLPYIDLISSFAFAEALFIPLRKIKSEIARFPNKVCEYIAAGGIIISTQIGEISNYFTHQENALLCKNYCIKEMVELLDNIANSVYDMSSIKDKSYRTGLEYFDLYAYQNGINDFLASL